MIRALVRRLGRGVVRTMERWLAGPPREPTAEDNRGAGI